MPYMVEKRGKWWCKIHRTTGKVVSRHSSKAKAKASIRATYANKK